METISGYYKPTGGSIDFDGHRISGLRPDQIAKQGIARTFQSNVRSKGLGTREHGYQR